jgi:tetratricopeptide (TPR) repeat protein
MKPIIIVIWLVVLNPGMARVGAQPFEESLRNAFARFDTALSRPSIVAGTADLDAIAVKYPDRWASHFYSAYARLKTSFGLTDKGQRDQLIDAAEAELDKADKLSPNNQEVFILRAWSAKARLAVDPQARWKKCNALYDEAIGKAKKIGAENPRIYFLDGQGYFYKPRLWGGGKDKARPFFQKAKQLFAKESKGDILRPFWGEKANEEFLAKCND